MFWSLLECFVESRLLHQVRLWKSNNLLCPLLSYWNIALFNKEKDLTFIFVQKLHAFNNDEWHHLSGMHSLFAIYTMTTVYKYIIHITWNEVIESNNTVISIEWNGNILIAFYLWSYKRMLLYLIWTVKKEIYEL